MDMRDWIAARLGRRFLVLLSIELLTASLVFLGLFLGIYSHQLQQERAQASTQVNELLQVALENAMLKRDLDGLRDIIYYLGRQEKIRRVSIVNPEGEVRFSSLPATVNDKMDSEPEGFAVGRTRFLVDEFGQEVLRSVNPVHNREPCSRCHGPVAEHPINGTLIVDYDAASIRSSAVKGALLLIASGGLVVVAALGGVWVMLRRHVLRPVRILQEAAKRVGSGDLEARADLPGHDELAELGDSFDSMTQELQNGIEALRRQEAFLQAVMDAVPAGIRVIDQDFRIVKANRMYCQQQGVALDQVIGRPCYASSHGRSERCPPTLLTCPLVETFKEGASIKCMHRHKTAEGAEFPVEVHAAPLKLSDGRSLVIEAISNMTDHVRFSHEQKLSALGQLAAGVAHEIRNPLASVRLALQASLRSADQGVMDPAEVSNYLRLVDGQVDKCIDVTDRLLRLSANGGGVPQLVDINRAVVETLSLLNWEAEAGQVQMVTELDAHEPRVLADDGEIRMIVLNLVQNAFHAMPKGGKLIVGSHLAGGLVELSFRDNGIGIPKDALPRIFDPFFTRRAGGQQGTGLGLTICRSLVKNMGGEITVVSVEGDGAAFTVCLPAAEGGLS